jgi:hypothetical protein
VHVRFLSSDTLVTLDVTRGLTVRKFVRAPVTEDAGLAVESVEVLTAMNAGTVLPGPASRGRME